MRYRADIDGLRGISVLLVLFFHVQYRTFQGGFIGVDIFFVISGYLITSNILHSISQSSFSLAYFYLRRMHRLLPALYVTLLITVFSATFLLGVEDALSVTHSAASAVLSLSNVRFYLQSGYFDTSAYRKPLLHTWSLAVEEQFYLVWPMLLQLLRSYHEYAHVWFAVAVVPLGTLISHTMLKTMPAAMFFLSPFRAYQFMIGAGLSALPTPRSSVLLNLLSLAALGTIVYCALSFSNATAFPGVNALLPCSAAALILHSAPNSYLSYLLSSAPIVFIGRISYSLYLVHWPLIVLFRYIIGRDALEPGEKLFLVSMSVVLGYCLHLLVETRFRQPPKTVKEFTDGAHLEHGLAIIRFSFISMGMLALCFFLSMWGVAPGIRSDEHFARALNMTQDDFGGVNISEVIALAESTDSSEFMPSVEFNYTHFGNAHTYFGHPGRPRVLVLGDSHAGRLRALSYHLNQRFGIHVEIWTGRGCPPLFGVRKVYSLRRQFEQPCRYLSKAWRAIIPKSNFSAVILAARWSWLVEGPKYGDFEIRQDFLIEDDLEFDESHLPPLPASDEECLQAQATSRGLFKKALRTTAQEITASGAQVIITSQVPNLGRSPRGCLTAGGARTALKRGVQPGKCVGVSRLTALQRLRFVNNEIRAVARLDNVTALVPSRYFCDNQLQDSTRCRALLDRLLLYDDSTHISSLGSAFLTLRWQADGYNGARWR